MVRPDLAVQVEPLMGFAGVPRHFGLFGFMLSARRRPRNEDAHEARECCEFLHWFVAPVSNCVRCWPGEGLSGSLLHCKCLIANVSLLIPHRSCLVAHTSFCECLIAHTSLTIPSCSYFQANTSVLISRCPYLIANVEQLIPH